MKGRIAERLDGCTRCISRMIFAAPLAFLFICLPGFLCVRNKIQKNCIQLQLFGVKAGTIFFKSFAACNVGAQAWNGRTSMCPKWMWTIYVVPRLRGKEKSHENLIAGISWSCWFLSLCWWLDWRDHCNLDLCVTKSTWGRFFAGHSSHFMVAC